MIRKSPYICRAVNFYEVMSVKVKVTSHKTESSTIQVKSKKDHLNPQSIFSH